MQNQDEAEDTGGLVQLLWKEIRAEVEALKEQARHIKRQMPKPKKKPKQAVLNVGKQKSKYRKPQSTAMNQPEKAKAAQMEVPRLVSNNQLKRNQRNWNQRKHNKRMSDLRNRNNNCGIDRNRGQNTDPAVHLKQNCLVHAPPRPYQTANQNQYGFS